MSGFEMISLTPLGVTQDYVDLLNDKESMRFTESWDRTHTLESQRAYVAKATAEGALMWELRSDGAFAGVLKLTPFGPARHKVSWIGIVVHPKFRRRRVASRAIGAVKLMDLRLLAGVYEVNIASCRFFRSCGFKKVGAIPGARMTMHVHRTALLIFHWSPFRNADRNRNGV